MELVYYSKDVAKQLNISPGTLRKWSIALEAGGYEFTKDENARRAYKERDIVELLKLKQHLANKLTMKNAIKLVTTSDQDTTRTLPVLVKNEEIMRSYERSQAQFFNSIMEELKNASKEIAAMRQENQELREIIEKSMLKESRSIAKWFKWGKG
jgi:transposase-like protein